jgi:hypothetical protein
VFKNSCIKNSLFNIAIKKIAWKVPYLACPIKLFSLYLSIIRQQIQSTQTHHINSVHFCFVFHYIFKLYMLAIIRWNIGTEGTVLQNGPPFTISQLKYIRYYSKKSNNKKKE